MATLTKIVLENPGYVKPKIYRMNHCDTVIAHSKKQAVDYYFHEEYPDDDIETVRKDCRLEKNLKNGFWWVSSEEEVMEKINNLGAYDEIKVGNWAGQISFWVTFQHVIDNLLGKIDIPCIICSTEW